MQYTQLGKTDLNVSRICFGCWQLSPRFWGEIDLRTLYVKLSLQPLPCSAFIRIW